jgi:hypothetical protein
MNKPTIACLVAVMITVARISPGNAIGIMTGGIFQEPKAAAADRIYPGDSSPAPDEPVPDGNPYVYADRESGRWVYQNAALSISIQRIYDPDQKIIWYESYIRCSGEVKLRSLMPGSDGREQSPVAIANRTGAVLAFSDDFYGDRRQKKTKQGIIIRNGKIFSNDTYPAGSNHFPNLEVMALFADGNLKTYQSNEYSAEEYIGMGVTDTYAFGPILVQNGKIDERLMNKEYMPYRDPRCAIGMISTNFYIVLTVEGRTSVSRGARLSWLASKMLELGAVEAINLDGGNTTALVFMGDLINHRAGISEKSIRYLNSMIGIGER